MGRPLRVLIVEDSKADAELLLLELERGGYEPRWQRVDTPEAMSAALENESWDIIISDYVMPRFNGLDALRLVQEKGLDLPFIVTSGKIDEDVSVEVLKAGAHDFVVKGRGHVVDADRKKPAGKQKARRDTGEPVNALQC